MSEERLGKYRLLRLLATGGMGEVFFARQEGPAGFAKPAVVKRVLAHLAREPAFIEMFLNEARIAALLQHANVVQIFELGEEHGRHYIAMEYVHGRNLRAVHRKLREKGREFPPAQLARIVSQALAGLHYAHQLKGDDGRPLRVVHRDMSPDNILVGFDGAVKVFDFGIAKASSAAPTTTRSGMVKGKFAYMSPEHLRGEPLDARTDLWAVGVSLYELLAGARPFDATAEAQLVEQVLTLEPQPLHEVAPHVPRELSTLVHRALEKPRSRRWTSAEELAGALERFAGANDVLLTNSGTKAFMLELYGEESDLNPGRLTPMALPPVSRVGALETATGASPRRYGLYIAAGCALGLFAAGVASMLLRPSPLPLPPAAVAKAEKAPEPPLAPAPVAVAAPSEPDAGASVAPAPAPAQPARDAKGKLDLRVLPWAEVFEGKRALGVTPMAPLELSAGAHTLTLRNSDLSVSRAVVVKVTKNATITVRVDLRDAR